MEDKNYESSLEKALVGFPTTITAEGLCGIVRKKTGSTVESVYLLLPDARKTKSPFPSKTKKEVLGHFPRVLVNLSGLGDASKLKINYIKMIQGKPYGVIFLDNDKVSFTYDDKETLTDNNVHQEFIQMEKLFSDVAVNDKQIKLPEDILTGDLQTNKLAAQIKLDKGDFSTSDDTPRYFYDGSSTESVYTNPKKFKAVLTITAKISSMKIGDETYSLVDSGGINNILIENLPLFSTNLRKNKRDDDFDLVYILTPNNTIKRALTLVDLGPGESRPMICALASFPDITG